MIKGPMWYGMESKTLRLISTLMAAYIMAYTMYCTFDEVAHAKLLFILFQLMIIHHFISILIIIW